jgi:hypothetical protein
MVNVCYLDLTYSNIQYFVSSAVCVRYLFTHLHTNAICGGVPSCSGVLDK